jgi:hypothetical protein
LELPGKYEKKLTGFDRVEGQWEKGRIRCRKGLSLSNDLSTPKRNIKVTSEPDRSLFEVPFPRQDHLNKDA